MFSEGMGAARGASGKVVEIGKTPDLTKYKGLRIEVVYHAGQPAAYKRTALRVERIVRYLRYIRDLFY